MNGGSKLFYRFFVLFLLSLILTASILIETKVCFGHQSYLSAFTIGPLCLITGSYAIYLDKETQKNVK